jgi:hypothetical protein
MDILRKSSGVLTGGLIVCLAMPVSAQNAASGDTRTQYPAFMRDSYFTIRGGSIGYLFSSSQLEPGFQAASIEKPRPAVRIDFFGHYVTKHLAVQLTYMRPGQFVEYNNINGPNGSHPVSNAYAGPTLVGDMKLGPKISAYVEGGYGLTSRSGIVIDGKMALAPAHYGSALVGLGLAYQWTPTFDLLFGVTYSPGRQSFDQPSTRMYTFGARYNMRPIPAADAIANRDAGYLFPANVVRAGYSTNKLTYGVNDLFSKYVVIFWGGHVETRQGFTIEYERNVFHSKKRFAFDLGASASMWQTDGTRARFRTLSAYPLVRYFFGRTAPADVYFSYSIAGPTYISEHLLDRLNTGARFTFQDSMGVGAFIGKARRMNIDISIKHFSNGNLATHNAGIKIPLTFKVGLTF